jgi:hypothetical protein
VPAGKPGAVYSGGGTSCVYATATANNGVKDESLQSIYTAPRTANLCSMAKQATTKVGGYFNDAKWPIQIHFAKLNISLTLKPGEFICDSAGRKINDPLLEAFVRPGHLARELVDVPVPVNGLDALAARCR